MNLGTYKNVKTLVFLYITGNGDKMMTIKNKDHRRHLICVALLVNNLQTVRVVWLISIKDRWRNLSNFIKINCFIIARRSHSYILNKYTAYKNNLINRSKSV